MLGERDLAALVWSFAALGLSNLPLRDAIASAAIRPITEFAPRSLANIAWAFAILDYGAAPFLHAIAAEALGRISRDIPEILPFNASGSPLMMAQLEDFLTNLNSIAWASHFVGVLTEELDSNIHKAVLALARMRDQLMLKEVAQLPLKPISFPPRHVFAEEGADPDMPPTILLDLPDICVVHKPAGWEVDSADVGTGIWLSSYLQQCYTPHESPLVHCQKFQFGMVHRLDRVSSGLVLIGKTFVGFHSLGWQLNTGKLEREYMVVVHGWVAAHLRLIDAKVLHVHAEGHRESTVTEQGKPSRTRLTTLGHYTLQGHHDETLSILVIQICTGRRHQIRAHLAHVGHPTVADGKYMAREPYVRDKQWCERNFLHRYRLGFHDVGGRPHEVVAPLPPELRAALSHLVPVGPGSAAACRHWAGGEPPRPWASYQGLPTSCLGDL